MNLGGGEGLGLRGKAATMGRLVPSPTPCHWLVVLLLFLLGEQMPAMTNNNLLPDPQGSACSKIWQYPRYVARKRGSVVKIHCYTNNSVISSVMTWIRKQDNQEFQVVLQEEGHISTIQNGSVYTLTIQGIQYEDNGIYICKQECTSPNTEVAWGCGTELRVLGFSTLAQLKRRNTLKDGIIMIQTLLIILFIVVPIFLLLDKDDSKAGLEEDHTYEGLDIDQTATYEDIVTLRTGEVKWSVGEHPGQE